MRKRKVAYPVAKTATRRAPSPGSDASPVRPNLATIDLTAGAGRAGLAVGQRVRIERSGSTRETSPWWRACSAA